MEQASIDLDGRLLSVWPEGQKLSTRGDPNIVVTRFVDSAAYHARLIEAVLAAAEDAARSRRQYRSGGGTKIYRLEDWGCPELDLVCARARAMFRHALKADTAVVDLSWANIYRNGDYAMAHSHERAVASIVYFVDLGEESPRDPLSGRFAFVDPRIKACAGKDTPRVIAPLLPRVAAGDMLLFPAAMVHSVNPYLGKRPRITLAWNMGREAVPGKALPFAD